jgi:hypothetical protein
MTLQEEKLDHAEEIDEKDTSGTVYTHVEDPVLEKKIVRHLDRRILPFIFALWLLAFIDRSSIGNAKIDGLIDDLNLTGNKYNISLTVFYILYVLVDIPSNWLLKIVGGGRYLPILALAWGIVGTCMGAVKSYPALIVCRMLLGACEGGMFGGIILYLSMFYKRHQLMFRLGVSACRFAECKKVRITDTKTGLLLCCSPEWLIWWSPCHRPRRDQIRWIQQMAVDLLCGGCTHDSGRDRGVLLSS